MTHHQFALAVNADEKWVENTARLLGHSLQYERHDARWFALVRMFTHSVGLTLAKSAALATEALKHPEATGELRLGGSSDAAVVVIDLARFHSAHNAAVSAALILSGPRKRGRPANAEKHPRSTSLRVSERAPKSNVWDALARAKAYGVDLSALREGLSDTPSARLERLEENALFVREMRDAQAGR